VLAKAEPIVVSSSYQIARCSAHRIGADISSRHEYPNSFCNGETLQAVPAVELYVAWLSINSQ